MTNVRKLSDSEINQAFAQHILNVEARRDSKGWLTVYKLPAGDGGGTFEVAGINDRYHPKAANKLKEMLRHNNVRGAEQYAKDYLLSYTHKVDEWHPNEVVEGYLRSCAFNRGAGGAAWMLQYALKYAFYPSLYRGKLDRVVGRNTKAAAKKADAGTILTAIYGARIIYERTAIPGLKGKRLENSRFWHGLFRRFTNDMVFAQSLRQL